MKIKGGLGASPPERTFKRILEISACIFVHVHLIQYSTVCITSTLRAGFGP